MIPSSPPRSGIGADIGRLSVSGIGYGNPHIRPDCHPYDHRSLAGQLVDSIPEPVALTVLDSYIYFLRQI
ncbi:hypothetical protein RHMOL_Rhmol13G0139400 [Rhododendron molle]|uniref:Uncharacterized protein n=1 Tax=Rhododendron molle TaxID=49168 RepID=A0ACC0L6Z8_RHOML|nr:hypothetical protein RHMOL_Rhmol13G0139400 [Rhododendron molle]